MTRSMFEQLRLDGVPEGVAAVAVREMEESLPAGEMRFFSLGTGVVWAAMRADDGLLWATQREPTPEEIGSINA